MNSSLEIVELYFGEENASVRSWEEVSTKFMGVLKHGDLVS